MKFETGKFYLHDKGRAIYVAGEVKTFKWGEMLIIEETDPTGHAISCVEKKGCTQAENWTEIGRKEFLNYFNKRKEPK